MIKILYTFTAGFARNGVGGGSKIVYEILMNFNSDRYSKNFLSADLEKNYDNITPITRISIPLSFKKRIGAYLFQKSKLYHKIFSHPSYLEHRFKRICKKMSSLVMKYSSYEIIHAHDSHVLYFFRDLKNVKKILTIHSRGSDSDELTFIYGNSNYIRNIYSEYRRREIVAFNSADIVTFPSIAAKNMFLTALNLADSKKVKIVYNGIDLENINANAGNETIFSKYNIPQNCKHYLLNIALHFPAKNIDKTLIALKICNDRTGNCYHLINAGFGPVTAQLKNIVSELGLQESTSFLGGIPNEDIFALMKRCSIFVLIGEKIVFDLALLEALACGMAVVVSNNGGNKEVIKDGYNGYFVRDMTPESIAEKILEVDVNIVKENALATAKLFSREKMIENYKLIYDEILKINKP